MDEVFLAMSPTDLRDYLLWLQVSRRVSSTINTHALLIPMLRRKNPGTVHSQYQDQNCYFPIDMIRIDLPVHRRQRYVRY